MTPNQTKDLIILILSISGIVLFTAFVIACIIGYWVGQTMIDPQEEYHSYISEIYKKREDEECEGK